MKYRRIFGVIVGALLLASAGGAGTAQAQVLIEEYFAFLGPADHFNSSGQRLTLPWQIIRQDRANFHRFGVRDAGDQWDSFFASAQNRERMESMLANGSISATAARDIVNSNVWIRVQIYGFGNVGQYVRVLVE